MTIPPNFAAPDAASVAPKPSRKSSKGRTTLIVIVTAVVVLFVAAGVAAVIPVPYYAITPGNGLNVSSLIHVPTNETQTHKGSVLLTDVELIPLRALTYGYFKWFDGDADVEKNATIIGTETPAQYDEAGVIDMDNARVAATAVALKTLKIANTTTPTGSSVYETFPNSPAAKPLPVGSVITAVNGKTTLLGTNLISAVQKLSPGTTVSFTFHKLGKTKATTTAIRLGAEYQSGSGPTASVSCLSIGTHSSATALKRSGKLVSCIGVVLQQEYKNSAAPFPISIDADGIIGPSAGLAFTLGLIQKLDHGDLTGGQRIAATGTMAVDGSVGDVGGVAQKTVAVRNAGATIFFVPVGEYKVAKPHAGPHLRIVEVSNISQVLSTLKSLGGRISYSPPRS